jgi:hypothetical protein
MDCSVSVGAVMALGTHIIAGQKAAAAVCLHGGVLPVWWRVGGEGESVTKSVVESSLVATARVALGRMARAGHPFGCCRLCAVRDALT